jgi:PTS system mannose-specific IIC component
MSWHEAAIWGLILAIPFAYLYRWIDIRGRHFNVRIMHWVEKGIQNGKDGRISLGIVLGLFFFVSRAFLFYMFAMIIGGMIYENIYLQLPELVIDGFKKAWYLLPVSGFGMIMHNFRNIKTPLLRHWDD